MTAISLKKFGIVLLLALGTFGMASTVLAEPETAPITTPTASAEAVAETSLASFAGCTGPDCSTCHIVDIANGLIKWLIGFLFVLFAGLVAYAGFGLVTSGGNQGALESAKEKFTNAIIGMLLVLSAWLIVDTIMRGLVGEGDNRGMIQGSVSGWMLWSQVECYTNTAVKDAGEFDIGTFTPYEAAEDVSIIPATRPGPSGVPVPNVGTNCGFNERLLVNIPGHSGQRSTAAVANHFATMRNSLASKGITLGVVSSYRSDARQTELWDQCPTCQVKKTVARPCSRNGNGSRHSSGVALDLSSSGNRCDIVNACRAAGASFIMTYSGSGHVHCDWGGGARRENLTISCPQ